MRMGSGSGLARGRMGGGLPTMGAEKSDCSLLGRSNWGDLGSDTERSWLNLASRGRTSSSCVRPARERSSSSASEGAASMAASI